MIVILDVNWFLRFEWSSDFVVTQVERLLIQQFSRQNAGIHASTVVCMTVLANVLADT